MTDYTETTGEEEEEEEEEEEPDADCEDCGPIEHGLHGDDAVCPLCKGYAVKVR